MKKTLKGARSGLGNAVCPCSTFAFGVFSAGVIKAAREPQQRTDNGGPFNVTINGKVQEQVADVPLLIEAAPVRSLGGQSPFHSTRCRGVRYMLHVRVGQEWKHDSKQKKSS